MHWHRNNEWKEIACRQQFTTAMAEEGAAEEKQPASHVTRQKSPRQPLPEHLPREEHVIEPSEPACPQCGGHLRRGNDAVCVGRQVEPERCLRLGHAEAADRIFHQCDFVSKLCRKPHGGFDAGVGPHPNDYKQ